MIQWEGLVVCCICHISRGSSLASQTVRPAGSRDYRGSSLGIYDIIVLRPAFFVG